MATDQEISQTHLDKYGTTREQWIKDYPFPEREHARAYCEANPQYECFAVRRFGVSRWGLRPAGFQGINGRVDVNSLPPLERGAPVAKADGEPVKLRKWQLMMQLLPATYAEIAASLSCTTAAASALISDARRAGHTFTRDDKGRYHVDA